MFCESCLEKIIDKLSKNEIEVLEYLLNENSIIPQCAVSRSTIKDHTDLSEYKCYTSLDRLECYGMVGQQSRSKANKYYITESGKHALTMLDKKMVG